MRETTAMERELGFDVIGCPEYDLSNINDWMGALTKPSIGGRGLGMIDTDWSRTLGGLMPTASLAWNKANRTVMLSG